MNNSEVQGMNELINLARGPRSIAEFARDCGISKAHIFRIKNGVRPSRRLCKSIAEDKYVKQMGISCETVFKAAGYTAPADITEAQQHKQLISDKGQEALDIGIVTQRLMESSFTNQLLPVAKDQDVDFAFQVLKGRKKVTWNFVIAKSELQDAKSQRLVNDFYFNLGRLVSLVPSDKEQYTMIVHHENQFDRLTKVANIAQLKGRVSVAWVDIDQKKIMKEAFVGPDKAYYTLSDYN